MKTKRALYAGSFDPFTNGHKDIIDRALNIFDEIVIVVAVSPSKKSLFSIEQRKKIIEQVFKKEKRVKVDIWEGLIVDYVEKNNIHSLVRGLRPTGDFDPEFQMASMNRKLSPQTETVFLMTGDHYYYISSSLVKEVFSHGGAVQDLVPQEVYKAMKSLKNK